jgi:hypothetical protein
MTDMFLDDYPDEWLDRCFAVMTATPHHTHQVLTKRERRMREYASNPETPERIARQVDALRRRTGSIIEWPLPNCWWGVSAENQKYADQRIPLLLQTPARVRFVSADPLLSSLDLSRYLNAKTETTRRESLQSSDDGRADDRRTWKDLEVCEPQGGPLEARHISTKRACSKTGGAQRPQRIPAVRATVEGKRYATTAHRFVFRHFYGQIPTEMTVTTRTESRQTIDHIT